MGFLDGKAALVTGSLGGIGFATARALAAEGCSVMLNGFAEAEVVEARKRELEGLGVRAAYHGADLTRPAEIELLVEATVEAFGSVDVLVNNAVVRHFAPVEDFAIDDWDRAIAVNLSAPFHLIRLAMPHMKRAGWGRIVNLASIYGLFATVNRIDYVTTKTALIGMARAVALETAGLDITCNAVCPGTVLTPAIDARIRGIAEREGRPREEVAREFVGARQPSGRFVEEADVAALILFLCGPHGRDVTGTALPIDGGWNAGR